jgi:hypothetical protein
MTIFGSPPEHATQDPRKKLISRAVLPLLFFAFLLFIPMKGFSQVTSTDRLSHTVYKFSITDISTPELALPVQMLLMDKPYASSCSFIDECDCFKMSVSSSVEYTELAEALSHGGYALSEEIFVSDGRILKSDPLTIELK